MKKILNITLIITVLLFIIGYTSDISIETLKSKYASNNSSKFIDIDGMQVHYKIEGPETDSIPLILIHGTSSSLFTWDACVKEWSKKHRVIRFDLPAFGLTGPNKNGNYTYEYYVEFLNKLLTNLHVNKCIVAGNSLGGGIAAMYAHTYPQKVDKVILLDADGYIFKIGKGGMGFKTIKTLGKIPGLRQSLYVISPRFMIEKSVKDVYFDKSKITQKTYDTYVDFMLREGNRKALVERLTTPVKDRTEEIKTIIQPTLIIWGDHDDLIPTECAYKFKKDIKNSKLVMIKNSGHIPMEESPEQVIPAVEDFLNSK